MGGRGWGLIVSSHVTPSHICVRVQTPPPVQVQHGSLVIIFSIPISPLISITKITYFILSSPRFYTLLHPISHPTPTSPHPLSIRLVGQKSIRVKIHSAIASSRARYLSLYRPQRLETHYSPLPSLQTLHSIISYQSSTSPSSLSRTC